ncbi:hypothetical protein DE146DRAFT_794053 [Phaeosphaeria sp. MPI-PUGE-AT-0046c]|nr:hypothetical protein DE146DRAFT_794053 [Phaeosphaeria sp. MPI-PUGE-AT-0046c]
MSLVRLVTLIAFAVGLVFGAQQTYFTIGTSHIFGKDVDPDLKLAFLGFFNKSLDVLVLSAIEYTARILLTKWMTSSERSAPGSIQGSSGGVLMRDFDLKDELTKPWMTIIAFITQWRKSGLTFKMFGRFLLYLSVSISVMLLGVAVNTIVIPKDRWYPDPDYNAKISESAPFKKIRTVQYPKTILQHVDWDNLLAIGQNSARSTDKIATHWLDALSASFTIEGLSQIVPTVGNERKAWQHV